MTFLCFIKIVVYIKTLVLFHCSDFIQLGCDFYFDYIRSDRYFVIIIRDPTTHDGFLSLYFAGIVCLVSVMSNRQVRKPGYLH